jgi:polyhydroxyalkanoate synthase
LADAAVDWVEGSSKLFNFEPEDSSNSPVVLFIPSLINRSYILDLSRGRSFMRYLQAQNIHSYLIDWGEPLASELGFTFDDYIAGRLDRVIDRITQQTNKKIFLAGYCMGGLMATASALRHQPKLQGLALFATPWDFHVKEFARISLEQQTLSATEKFIDSSEKIAANIIQSMFYYLHPNLISQKFDSFFSHIQDPDQDEFMAMEHWVNDGISMTRAIAQECFINWVQHNDLMSKHWQVEGQTIDPSAINLPAFFSIANKDQIVPPTSTFPLIDMFTDKKVITSDTGHVSMIAGSKAQQMVWEPFADWIRLMGGK